MAVSQILIVTTRGELILQHKSRKDIRNIDPVEIFRKKLAENKSGIGAPTIKHDDVTFHLIKRSGLYFVAVVKADRLSAIVATELLTRLHHICKDFCGAVTEDTMRSNLLLIQELLMEMFCQGYVQLCSTEKLKAYIQSDPIPVRPSRSSSEETVARLFGMEQRMPSNTAANQPVMTHGTAHQPSEKSNEVFVDVVERLTVLVNSDGTVGRLNVTGSINMRCFISGPPQIRLALNDDLTIHTQGQPKGYGSELQLDRCQFHPAVRLDEFEHSRVLIVHPPEGEFSVLQYSVSSELPLSLPFLVRATVQTIEQSRDVDLQLHIHSEFPASLHAVNVIIKVPVSKLTTSISQQLSGVGQTAIFNSNHAHIVWSIKQFTGNTEHTAKFRLINQSGATMNTTELGPVSMEFEISGFAISGLHVRYLRIYGGSGRSEAPHRWVRYITVSNSFIVKII